MVMFIPEWNRASGRDLKLKHVLNGLDDACIVRRPLQPLSAQTQLFIQHPERGWLALSICEQPFTLLDPEQLFASPERQQFEQLLQQLQLEHLVLMWNCSPEQVRSLSKHYLKQFGVRLLSKQQFLELGSKLIPRLQAPLSQQLEQALLVRFFPETEIPALCSVRPNINRDVTAQLTRYFLDSDQEWATKLDLEPLGEAASVVQEASIRLINGIAGSGKTLIALKRGLLLAHAYPQQTILLLIHNAPIVADLKARVQRAYGKLPANLDISTFYSWVSRQWHKLFGYYPQTIPDFKIETQLRRIRRAYPALKLSNAQLLDELNFINDTLCFTETDYLDTKRSGRGFALRAKERSDIWLLYQAVRQELTKQKLYLWSDLPTQLCQCSASKPFSRYQHILIDEAQFFAPSWFQLVKRCLQPTGQLFLCADPNQGFMRNRLSWKSVGLEVKGRTKKLRKSYRTTQALLSAADQCLKQLTLDDPEEFLSPDFTDMELGTPPLFIQVATPQDALERTVNEICALAKQAVPLSQLLLIYGEGVAKEPLYKRLQQALGEQHVWWLNKDRKQPPAECATDYLRMAYLDSATGLEAAMVFLLGVEHLVTERYQIDCTLSQVQEDPLLYEGQQRKFYMAMTRAGSRLVWVSPLREPPVGWVKQGS